MQYSDDHRQQALTQPLILGNHEAVINDDIDLLAEHISLAVPLRDIAALGPQQQFRQRSSYRIAGDMGLTAAIVTPTRMWVDESHDCSMVLLNHGHATYQLENKTYEVHGGNLGIFLPGMEYSLESSLAGGLVYNLSPQLLARYLCEASDGSLDLDAALHLINRPQPINLAHPAISQVLFGLEVLIRTIDSMGKGQDPDSEAMVKLQEGIYALSAALLMPESAPRALSCWQPMPCGIKGPFPGASAH
jgi:hypothetical protein